MKPFYIAALLFSGMGFVLSDPQASSSGYTSFSYDTGGATSMPDSGPSKSQPQTQTFPTNQNIPGTTSPKQSMSRMAAYFGDNLIKISPNGDAVPIDPSQLGKLKFFALYFSASWCPSCQSFTPELIQFYNSFHPSHPSFDIILICGDNSEEDMLSYMSNYHMQWNALRFGLSDKVSRQYQINGIPNLVFMDSNGQILSTSVDGKYSEFGRVFDAIKSTVPEQD